MVNPLGKKTPSGFLEEFAGKFGWQGGKDISEDVIIKTFADQALEQALKDGVEGFTREAAEAFIRKGLRSGEISFASQATDIVGKNLSSAVRKAGITAEPSVGLGKSLDNSNASGVKIPSVDDVMSRSNPLPPEIGGPRGRFSAEPRIAAAQSDPEFGTPGSNAQPAPAPVILGADGKPARTAAQAAPNPQAALFDSKLHGREALPVKLRGVNDDDIVKAIKGAEGKFHQVGLQKNAGRDAIKSKEQIEKEVLEGVGFIDRTLWHARPKKVETVYKSRYETEIREAIGKEADKFEDAQRLYRVNRADAANDIAYLVARKHNLDVLNNAKEGDFIDLTKPWEVKSYIESTAPYNTKAGPASRVDPNMEYHNGSIDNSDNVFDKVLHDKIDGQDLAVTKQDSDLRKERIVRFFEEKDFAPSRLIGKTIAGNLLDGTAAGGATKVLMAFGNLPLYALINAKGVISKALWTGAAVVGTGYLAEEAETRDNAGNDYKGKGFDKGQMIDKGFVFAGDESKWSVLSNNSGIGAFGNAIRIWWNSEEEPKVIESGNPEAEAAAALNKIRSGKTETYDPEAAAKAALEAIREGNASSAKPTELPQQQLSPEAAAAAALEAARNGKGIE